MGRLDRLEQYNVKRLKVSKMDREYYVAYLDNGELIELGPSAFYGKEFGDEGFPNEIEAELAMSAARKAALKHGAYGGAKKFVITSKKKAR
jgi:hypothetical protein